jgi:hypothetical protein
VIWVSGCRFYGWEHQGNEGWPSDLSLEGSDYIPMIHRKGALNPDSPKRSDASGNR